MTQRSFVGLGLVLLVAACGGHSQAGSPAPAPSAEHAVQAFLGAVTDSNVAKMAQLWGSAKGPAAQTHEPSDYQRRIVVIQSYLRGARYRILSNDPITGDAVRRQLQVELSRDRCQKVVPFMVIETAHGWIINSIDIGAAGSPGRPCDTPPQ